MNFVAIIVAALIPMIIGFIWYHPKVFGNTWMQVAGMTEEKVKTGNKAGHQDVPVDTVVINKAEVV